jgi:hypothetical protein
LRSVPEVYTLARRVLHVNVSKVAVVVLAAVTLCASAAASATANPVHEHVDLSRTATHGSSKFTFDGRATGTFSGPVHAHVALVHALILSGTVSVKTRDGTIRMKLSGRTRSATARARFDGTAKITSGTGRYRNATGSARFSGIVNRTTRTWHTTLDVSGSFES